MKKSITFHKRTLYFFENCIIGPVGTTPDQKFTFDLNGPLTQEQAEFIYALGREAVIYALMILSAREASNNKN